MKLYRCVDACIRGYRTPILCALEWHHSAIIIPIRVISNACKTRLKNDIFRVRGHYYFIIIFRAVIKRLYLLLQFLLPEYFPENILSFNVRCIYIVRGANVSNWRETFANDTTIEH